MLFKINLIFSFMTYLQKLFFFFESFSVNLRSLFNKDLKDLLK